MRTITADADKIATALSKVTIDKCPNCSGQRKLRKISYTRLIDLEVVENEAVHNFHGHEGRFLCGTCHLASEAVPLIEYNLPDVGQVLLPQTFGPLVQHEPKYPNRHY
jgi:hypothetical protein